MDKLNSKWTPEAIEQQRNKPASERLRDLADYLMIEYQKWQRSDPTLRTASQAEFSKYLGVSPTSLSNWLKEIRPPSQENLDQLAAKFGMDVYWFMGAGPRLPDNKDLLRIFIAFYKLSPKQRKQLNEVILNMQDEAEEERIKKEKNSMLPSI